MKRRHKNDSECAECSRSRDTGGLSRRGFLQLLAGTGVAVTGTSLLSTQVGFAAPGYTGDVLVVLSFRGGFDGLSAVCPIADPNYAVFRPTIAVPEQRTFQLDSTFGMNVALNGVKPLWDAGNLAVVNAVGMPAPNRSHFAAMDEIEKAAPGSNIRTGWLDRALGSWAEQGVFDGVQLGSTSMPMAYAGPYNEVGLNRVKDFTLSGAWNETEQQKWDAALKGLHNQAPSYVKTPTETTLGALTTVSGLPAYTPENNASYPDTELGRAFLDAAQLIKANIGVRVITIDEGDWDMHAGLGTPEPGGWMFDKLQDVGDSIGAFFADLGALSNEVTLVTLSEFGRRVDENNSNGVDHGWGNVMMVAGGNVNGGVHGDWKGLNDAGMYDGDVKATTDYRAVLGDILGNRCDADNTTIQTVLPNYSGTHLGVTSP